MKLKVPLSAKGIVQNYEQLVRMFVNGNIVDVPAPIQPSIYTQFNLDETPEAIQNIFINPVTQPVQVRPSHKTEPEQWFRHEFSSEIAIKYLSKQLRESVQRSDVDAGLIGDYLSQSKLRTSGLTSSFIDKLLTEKPDWFKNFPQSSDLKIMVIDIEQLSKNEGFESTKKNTLISIGLNLIQGDHIKTFKYGGIKSLEDAFGNDDKEMLEEFVTTFKEFNPDIIVGYNICGYDLPVLCYRLEKNGFNLRFLDREGLEERPYFFRKEIGVNEMDVCKIGGRIVYDVFHAVMADQTLNGQVKNRKLKTIAKYYQRPEIGIIPADMLIVEEDMRDNSSLVGTEKLQTYNRSDVEITTILFDMYVKNNIAVAEFIACPLDKVVPMATSYPFTIICAQTFYENNIISAGKNIDRNREYFPPEGAKIKPYQGADVACFKRGRYTNIAEVDAASLYPSIVAALGIGADNTRILRTEAYNPEFRTMKMGERKLFWVPDTERNWTWVIEVDGYSKIAEKIREMLIIRIDLKDYSNLLKHYMGNLKKGKADPESEEKLRKRGESILIGDMLLCSAAQQEAFIRAYGLKVVLNSLYGLLGSKMNLYGELGAAALITGVGRLILGQATTFIGMDNCILEDTDGIKVTQEMDLSSLNVAMDKYVEENLFGLPLIRFEQETYPAIFSREMKTYLLLNNKGQLEIHGVGFKSSRKPPIFDRIIRELGMEMLKHGHEKTKAQALKFYKLKEMKPSDFIMTIRLGKPVAEYSNSALAKTLAEKYETTMGTKIRVGDTMEYVKTKNDFEPVGPGSLSRLDTDYYMKIVDEAVKSLGYKNPFVRTLSEFGL